MNIKFDRVEFRSEEEAEEFAKAIERRAVEGPYEYVFGYRGKLMRGKVYVAPDPTITRGEGTLNWIVRRSAREGATVWRVKIPGFAMCALKDGRRAESDAVLLPSGYRYKGKDLGGKSIQLCSYHGASTRVKVPVVKDKIYPVPDALCYRFCTQNMSYSFRDATTRRTVIDSYCRAMWKPASEEERVNRAGKKYGMRVMCMEDEWWYYYLKLVRK